MIISLFGLNITFSKPKGYKEFPITKQRGYKPQNMLLSRVYSNQTKQVTGVIGYEKSDLKLYRRHQT